MSKFIDERFYKPISVLDQYYNIDFDLFRKLMESIIQRRSYIICSADGYRNQIRSIPFESFIQYLLRLNDPTSLDFFLNHDIGVYSFDDHDYKIITFKTTEDKAITLKEMASRLMEIIEQSVPMHCPESGGFIGWKIACDTPIGINEKILVKLYIPASAKRSSGLSNKCRCDKAIVVAMYDVMRNLKVQEAESSHDQNCIYRENKMVYPDSFDDNRWNVCTNGIHFYMTPFEAMYNFLSLPAKRKILTNGWEKFSKYYGIEKEWVYPFVDDFLKQ